MIRRFYLQIDRLSRATWHHHIKYLCSAYRDSDIVSQARKDESYVIFSCQASLLTIWFTHWVFSYHTEELARFLMDSFSILASRAVIGAMSQQLCHPVQHPVGYLQFGQQ